MSISFPPLFNMVRRERCGIFQSGTVPIWEERPFRLSPPKWVRPRWKGHIVSYSSSLNELILSNLNSSTIRRGASDNPITINQFIGPNVVTLNILRR
jgi:hypothetical protein